MKLSSAFPLILLLVTACQKQKAGFRNRPLRSSADMTTMTSDTNYLRIHQRTWGRKLLLVDKQKQRQIASPDSLWGYETKDGARYRYFDRTYYKIEETTPLAIYSFRYWVSASNAVIQHGHYQTNYYFSKNSDSEIFPISKRELKSVFQTDPTLLQKLADRRWRVYDNKTKRYVMNQAYEEVHPVLAPISL